MAPINFLMRMDMAASGCGARGWILWSGRIPQAPPDRSMTDPSAIATSRRRIVRLWLLTVAALMVVVVLVGGATRLTESGLSIVEWKPVVGVVPPLSVEGWQVEF